MSPTLYAIHASPPVRTILITAKAIGLQLEEKNVDLFQGEHLKESYLKLNPQHTIPTLVEEDGFSLWESQAIMVYIVSKYAKNDDLYPKDVRKRALINQRLHFNSSVAFFHMRNIAKFVLFHGNNYVDPKEIEGVIEAYGFLEQFLEGNKWMAGNFVSVADYSLLTTISTLNIVVPLDSEKYPNIVAWLKRCEALPECEANRKGLNDARNMFQARLSKR